MLSAFIFLNRDIGAEPAIINEMNRIAGVPGTMRMSGVYDIVAKISEESKENMTRWVKKIHRIALFRSRMIMIVAEDSKSPDKVV